jgi:uncharacterized protein
MLNFSSFLQNSETAEELKPFLQQVAMSSSIAEAHGLFSGLICLENTTKQEQEQENNKTLSWVNKLDLDIDNNNFLVKEALEVVDSFYQSIKNSLSSSDIEFQLAIFENDSIEQRLADFSIWVQSFLYALGLNKQFKIQQCSEQTQEIINDLVNLSHAEDYELSAEEEDEQSLFEMIEYVRISTIIINDEFNPDNNPQKIHIPEELDEPGKTQLH